MTVSWAFTVDSLVRYTGFAVAPPLDPVGTLSVSDAIWQSGHLDWTYAIVDTHLFPQGRNAQTGQIDGWSMDLGPDIVFPYGGTHGSYNGSVSLTFDPLGDFAGEIVQNGWESTLRMAINDGVATGWAASDNTVFGCGFMGSCDYTGHWALVTALPQPVMLGELQPIALGIAVSEPASVALFLMAALIFAIYRRSKTGREPR